MKKQTDCTIIEGAITLELHGYLTTLKVNLPQAEDIVGGDYTLGKAILEGGIPATAVEKAIVNQSLVSMAHKINVGDYVVLYPLSVK
ncbi:MAG: hypothetical protein RSB05_06160 [Clostridiales bacterium]